ncbi:MAG: hypothetical protein SFY70_11435 [Bacteroidia bacterium]|nr:hypothetical protein [Bacteroidia bacterium]
MSTEPTILKSWGYEPEGSSGYAVLTVYDTHISQWAVMQGDFESRSECTHQQFLEGHLDRSDVRQMIGEHAWQEAKAFVKTLVG